MAKMEDSKPVDLASNAYNKQLASEIQASICDDRPSVPHDEVMDDMSAYIESIIQKQA